MISRHLYAKYIAAHFSNQIKDQLKGFYYCSIKHLLHVETNINTDKFLEKALGMPFKNYQEAAIITATSKVKPTDTNIRAKATETLHSAMDTLRKWTMIEGNSLIKW